MASNRVGHIDVKLLGDSNNKEQNNEIKKINDLGFV